RVVENLLCCREMLLHALQVAKKIACYDVQCVRNREALQAALANGKLERLVGERCGGGQVTRKERGRTSPIHQRDDFLQATSLLGQRGGAFRSVDRFRRGISTRDVMQLND